MFERLEERARLAAHRRCAERRAEIAERMASELPRGIVVNVGAEGVTLSGRRLKLRLALDPAVRALLGDIG
jgi:hypothetical protein